VPFVWFMRLWGLFGKRMRVVGRQDVRVDDAFGDGDRIVDLGGGGEGVIGRLRGRQVVAVDIRQGELDDAPDGPTKVVGDARALPFPDGSFDAATAFFFLMYVQDADRDKVLAEGYRVLRPGGTFRIWDAVIPEPPENPPRLFVVPVRVSLPRATVRTAYGTGWQGKAMSCDGLAARAEAVGFTVIEKEQRGNTFRLVAMR